MNAVQGRRVVVVQISEPVHRGIKAWAAEEGLLIKDLVEVALKDYAKKKNRDLITHKTRKVVRSA